MQTERHGERPAGDVPAVLEALHWRGGDRRGGGLPAVGLDHHRSAHRALRRSSRPASWGRRHRPHLGHGGTPLRLLGPGPRPGDEIICPSLTWPATANMAVALGARVVFADVEPGTLQVSPEDVERRDHAPHQGDRARPLRRAAGRPGCPRGSSRAAGSHHRGAAHAAGTEYRGRRDRLGHGNFAVFSFHPIKNMTTGEGGMLTTDADEAAPPGEAAQVPRRLPTPGRPYGGGLRRATTRSSPASSTT